MKIEQINIENYGCIDNFSYIFSKSENGFCKPLVLAGKNGSGKSLVIANIVDALIEFKRQKFPGGIQEVKDDNYYKIGSKSYIKSNKPYSKSYIRFENGIEYLDLMAHNPKEFNAETVKENLIDREKFTKTGYSKILRTKEIEDNDCYLYFPVDRYYIPSWQNSSNYSKFQDNYTVNNVGRSNTNIVKNNVGDNLHNWLYRLYSRRDYVLINGINGRPVNTFLPVEEPEQANINRILKTIKGQNASILDVQRSSDNVPMSFGNGNVINDINLLSSGEMMLFGIFASIVKEYDLSHNNYSLSDITGICIIDEIDLNLHISQQAEVLPNLIKLFPKVQFIISTHSPFFVSGLYNCFKGEFDILSMPTGKALNDKFDFSELKEAIKALGPDGEKYIEKLDEMGKYIKELESDQKPIIITEGKTDIKYIQKAYEKLGISSENVKFIDQDFYKYINGDMDLKDFIEDQKKLGANSKRIIAIFDNDNDKIKKYIGDGIKEVAKNKIYAFCIPIPSDRIGQDDVSIENYFTDQEIRTFDNGFRLYQAGEFDGNGIHTDKDKICTYLTFHKQANNYVLSGSDTKKTIRISDSCNVSLSKEDFCERVVEDKDGFDKFDFSKFRALIDLINNCAENIV